MQMSPERESRRDEEFVADLVRLVKRRPEWELDQLTSQLKRAYPHVYVDAHLQAITAAMMRAQGEM